MLGQEDWPETLELFYEDGHLLLFLLGVLP